MIAKSAFETSKKTLSTASIFTRAWVVPTIGSTTEAEPSFGVEAASTYGYVCPLSTERLIRTSAVPTGAGSVFATERCLVPERADAMRIPEARFVLPASAGIATATTVTNAARRKMPPPMRDPVPSLPSPLVGLPAASATPARG